MAVFIINNRSALDQSSKLYDSNAYNNKIQGPNRVEIYAGFTFFLFFMSIYCKCSQRVRERQRLSTPWLIPLMSTKAKMGPGQNQEHRIPSGYATWLAGTQGFNLSSIAS